MEVKKKKKTLSGACPKGPANSRREPVKMNESNNRTNANKHVYLLWITTNCEQFLKRWEYQITREICMQVKKQQLELDMEQQTGSKSGKEFVKAVYCHPAYLTYMQSTSWETLGWMKHKLESR